MRSSLDRLYDGITWEDPPTSPSQCAAQKPNSMAHEFTSFAKRAVPPGEQDGQSQAAVGHSTGAIDKVGANQQMANLHTASIPGNTFPVVHERVLRRGESHLEVKSASVSPTSSTLKTDQKFLAHAQSASSTAATLEENVPVFPDELCIGKISTVQHVEGRFSCRKPPDPTEAYQGVKQPSAVVGKGAVCFPGSSRVTIPRGRRATPGSLTPPPPGTSTPSKSSGSLTDAQRRREIWLQEASKQRNTAAAAEPRTPARGAHVSSSKECLLAPTVTKETQGQSTTDSGTSLGVKIAESTGSLNEGLCPSHCQLTAPLQQFLSQPHACDSQSEIQAAAQQNTSSEQELETIDWVSADCSTSLSPQTIRIHHSSYPEALCEKAEVQQTSGTEIKRAEWQETQSNILVAERWASNHSVQPLGVPVISYPSGVIVDLTELARMIHPIPDATSSASYPMMVSALATGNFAKCALEAYKKVDVELRGVLDWTSGSIHDFTTALFTAYELAPPSDSQVYRTYLLFDGGRGASISALDCLCLADAILRAFLCKSDANCSDNVQPDKEPASLANARNISDTSFIIRNERCLPDKIETWTPTDTAQWATHVLALPAAVGQMMVREEIHGPVLLSLEERDLESLGVAPFGRRRQLLLGIRSLRRCASSWVWSSKNESIDANEVEQKQDDRVMEAMMDPLQQSGDGKSEVSDISTVLDDIPLCNRGRDLYMRAVDSEARLSSNDFDCLPCSEPLAAAQAKHLDANQGAPAIPERDMYHATDHQPFPGAKCNSFCPETASGQLSPSTPMYRVNSSRVAVQPPSAWMRPLSPVPVRSISPPLRVRSPSGRQTPVNVGGRATPLGSRSPVTPAPPPFMSRPTSPTTQAAQGLVMGPAVGPPVLLIPASVSPNPVVMAPTPWGPHGAPIGRCQTPRRC